MQNFAIYKIEDGSLVSCETDEAQQRLSDSELEKKGLGRTPIKCQDASVAWNTKNLTMEAIVESANEKLRLSLIGAVDFTSQQTTQALQLILKTIRF